MKNFEPLRGTIRVSLDFLGFGKFYVLIVPNNSVLNYYLMHDASNVVVYMFGGLETETNSEAAEIAIANAPEYIAEFIQKHFEE